MRINRDFFDNPAIPDYILCKANRERIGVLQCTEKTIDLKFSDLNEISFTTHLMINNERNPCYDAIDVMKHILLPGIGFFSIVTVNTDGEGTEYESRHVTAKSCECLLAQKYLEELYINTGTAESIDGIQLYNIRDKDKSLLHLILEKCPEWKIGHIDSSLPSLQRSFEVTRQDIYSFLNDEAAAAFECFFVFDSLNNTINVYREDNAGKDTNIHVSYGNLLKHTNISCSTDNIKTCLTITGSDDLTVREINMGYDKIYNFGYYNSTEFMSSKLHDAYNKWIALRNSKLPAYTALLSQYQDYYIQINHLTHQKMPSSPDSTNWTEYGLQPLKEQLAAYERRQSLSMKAGHGEPTSKFYASEYLPVYEAIQSINAQLKILESQLAGLQDSQAAILAQMSEIIETVSMQNNFTGAELNELSAYIREDELNNSNYLVTDIMEDSERFEMLHELLAFGENELARASVPQLSFDADMVNLFAIPEFEAFYDDFEPGNLIWVTLRDDFSVKAKLLSIHVNFYDAADFKVSFGNVIRKSGSRYADITRAVREASSAAKSVSFNSSYWNRAAKDASSIGQMLDRGLIAAGKYLKNGDDSEMVIDTRGIFVNTTSGPYAGKDSIYMGGGRILFTDDNWKTVSEAIGRIDIKGDSVFGVLAQAVIAGYIAGCEIVAGNIFSSNYSPDSGKGTRINLDDGTFTLGDGKLSFDGQKLAIKNSEIDWSTVNESENILSRITQNAGQIVLKADSNGRIVQAALGADADSGSEFKVDADNVSLNANDVINLMSGGDINLTGKGISITSDNFKVDPSGNVQCNNITAFSISGEAVGQFDSMVADTEALGTANEALDAIKNTIEILNRESFPSINTNIHNLQIAVANLEQDIANLDSRISQLEATPK